MREALEKRLLDEETDHAKLQLARLQPAMRIAAEAVADGCVEAIAPLLEALDRLDRYQRTAKVNQVYDEEARKRLFDKINRVAANLGYDHAKTAAEEAAESKDSDAAAGNEGPWKKRHGGSAQVLEKARSGQGNQS